MQEINFPEDVRKMLWILIGEMPLQARENLAYASQELYQDFGRGLRRLNEEIRRSISEASTSLPKDVGAHYVRGLSMLTDDGGVNHLDRMIDQLDEIARGQVDHSIKIQAAKWEIIAEIVMLLIELALLAALAAITGGTSLSQMALARARSKLAVLLIVQRLLRMSHLAPALTEAMSEALQTLAVRLAQIVLNSGNRRPDGIDWKDVGKAAAFGAVVGALGSVLEFGGNHLKNWFKKSFDDFDSFAKNHPNWNITLNGAGELGGAFVVGAVSESVGEYLVQGAFEGDWDFKWETFVGSGTSSVFDVVAGGAVAGGALWLHNKFTTDVDLGPLNDTSLLDAGGKGGPSGSSAPGPGPAPAPAPVPAPAPAPVPAPVVPPVVAPVVPPLVSTSLTDLPPAPVSVSTPPPVHDDGVSEVSSLDEESLFDFSDTDSVSSVTTYGSTSVPHTPVGSDPATASSPFTAKGLSPTASPGDVDGVAARDSDGIVPDLVGTGAGFDGTDSAAGPAGVTPPGTPAPHTGTGTGSGTGAPSAGPRTVPDSTGRTGDPAPEAAEGAAGRITDDTNTDDTTLTPSPSAHADDTGTGAPRGTGTRAQGGAEDGTSLAGLPRQDASWAQPEDGPADVLPAAPRSTTSAPAPDAHGEQRLVAEDDATGQDTGARPDTGDVPSPAVPVTATGGDTPLPGAVPAPAPPTGGPGFEAARAAAPAVTRSHVWVDPVSTPPDPARPGQTTQYTVRSHFDARRFEYGGRWITDLTVRVAAAPDGLPADVWDKVRSGVETYFNAPGHHLADGDLLHVTVEQVPSGTHPGTLDVDFVGRDRQMTRTAWWADADPIDYAHEIAHQLGLRDEARAGDPAARHRPDIPGSLLGDYTRSAPDGLAQGGLRGRHLALLSALVGDLTTASPERPAAASSGRRPVTTADVHLGAEPHAPRQPRAASASPSETVPPPPGTASGTGITPTPDAEAIPAPIPPPATPLATMSGPASLPGSTSSATPDSVGVDRATATTGTGDERATDITGTGGERATATPGTGFDRASSTPGAGDNRASDTPRTGGDRASDTPRTGDNPASDTPGSGDDRAGHALPPGETTVTPLDPITTAAGTSTAPITTPAPRERHWINTHLDRTRPPRLDRTATAPAARREPARFDDGTVMPSYADDLASLLPAVPADQLAELLADPVTFGQGDVALRGIPQMLAEIDSLLSGDASLRPRTPGRTTPPGTGLMADLRMTLARRPRTLTEGRAFPYTAADGRTRVLHVTARHYGNWSRFADDHGSPSKIDTMDRATLQAGQNKGVQSVTQLGLGGPFLGPASTLAFGGFGRLALRGGLTRKVGYGQTDQVVSQTETRTLDGSKVYLDDVFLELRVTDADGRDVGAPAPAAADGTGPAADPAPRPVTRSFAVRDGLMVRLPDSAVERSRPGRIPRTLALGHGSQYRLVRTEGFGPVSRIRDWAAGEIGARPGSTAYQELDTFFSSDSFRRHARFLAQGRLATAPLFADDRKRTPLGFFVVERVVAEQARLIGETSQAELRDINSSVVRNDRGLGRGVHFGVDGVVGPAFNFLDLGNGTLNLRLQFGPAFRYLFAVSQTAALGGFGALKTSGQVKGDPTGLYLVKKTVHVRRGGSSAPARRFQTWSVDRMTRTEARRLAGWDDGTTLRQRHGLPEPFAPAHLTVDHPVTLGMHRVEEFAHADGRRTDGTDDRGLTLPDSFTDAVLAAVAEAYPGIVAPLDQLAPPASSGILARTRSLFTPASARPAGHRWSDADAYRTAVANTLEILTALSHQSLSGGMEALISTGIRIRLAEPGTLGQGHRYIWVHGDLTNRRYEGRQTDLRLRHGAPGGQRLDGQESRRRALAGGADLQLAFRDPDSLINSAVGVPDNAGVLSLGWRSGVQHDDETGFGFSATNEPTSVSTGPSHLYRYDLALSVSHGGYWRFRGLLRGVASLGLLGTRPFVFSRPQDLLIGTTPGGAAVRGGPLTGQVLISVPDQHTPAVDPHRPGAANPYLSLRGPLDAVPMPRDRAFALASGDLSRPEGRAGGRGSRLFQDLQRHPFVTVGVVVPPALVDAVAGVVRGASGGAWQLTEEGAPAREAVMRAFQPQFATAHFDQSSGALGLGISGLMAKPPYATLWATFRHYTAVTDVQVLTGPITMDTETVLGSGSQAAGKLGRSTVHSFGGQLTYTRPHGSGPGPVGAYGIVLNPWSESSQRNLSVSRSVVADLNRKGFGHQVLVTGTVEHWAAMTSSLLGTAAGGRSFVPDLLAGSAGSVVRVPGGWLAHVPEKSAHRLGLIDDGLGDVPRYTRDGWSPQPWLRGNSFGTYPVNPLDPTTVLAAFQEQVARLGLDHDAREQIRLTVTSRVLRALDRELTGSGTTSLTRSGAWGWGGVRVGSRRARVRVELLPGTPTFEMLDHGTEMEENRRAVETVQQGAEFSSGSDIGVLVGEQVGTGNATAVASGPTYTETGSSRRAVSAGHSVSSSTTYRAASTEPHAEIATPYRLRLTLEFDDTPADGTPGTDADNTPVRDALRRFGGRQRVSETGDIGTLVEHVPLSLMAPDPHAQGPAPDPRLAPPDLTVTALPRSGHRPELLGPDVRYGDGTLRPFTFPENGFHVRRIVGLEHVHEANERALAEAFGIDLTALDAGATADGDRDRLLRRARATSLTRPGSAPAQALEDGTTNTALSTFYDQALAPVGYRVPGLTHRNPVGTDSAHLALHARPDFGGAELLSVADGQKLEVLRETAEGVSTSVSRDDTQDSALGGGVVVRTEPTGVNQIGAAGTGPYANDSDSTPVGEDHLSSVNVKPTTGRSFLFAVPTDWLSVAEVHRGIKDARVGRYLAGTFGIRRPGPKAVGSRTYALAWVREDVARELGLIDGTSFPAVASQAWDAVGKATKAWADADKAYWKKRRTALRLREDLDAARAGLTDARSRADAAGRRLAPLLDAADAADAAVLRAEADAGAARATARDLTAAADRFEATRTALDDALRAAEQDRARARAMTGAAQDALTNLRGLVELPGSEVDADTVGLAEEELRTARGDAAALLEAADLRADSARRAHATAADLLATAERNATPGTPDVSPDPVRARRTAAGLVTAADLRVAEARSRQATAGRRLTGPARADADARAALEAATGRLDAAQAAFDARRAELDALRTTAENAATEVHRVRTAADRLTRWHRLAATEEGRARLGDLPEPPPVTYTAPPAPSAAVSRAPLPRYDRDAGGAHITSPDQVTYTLHNVPRDGDAFFHALAEGLARTAPDVLLRHGIDPADPTTATALRRLVAARLADPGDADLLAAVAPDGTDRFTAAEIDATGPVPDLAPDTPGRREFDALGVVPHSVSLGDRARAELAVAQLSRPGDAADEAGWNNSAADLLPLLAARTFGVDVTVVRDDGTFQRFAPGAPDGRDGSDRLRGLLDEADGPRPHVVLSLHDQHYQLAVPTGASTKTSTGAGPDTGSGAGVLHAAPSGRLTPEVTARLYRAYADHLFRTGQDAQDFDSVFYAFVDEQDVITSELALHPRLRPQMERFHDELMALRAERAATATPITRAPGEPMRLYRKMSRSEAEQMLAGPATSGIGAAMAYNRSDQYRKYFTSSLSHTSVFSNANAASDDEVVVEFTLPWDGYWGFVARYGTPNQQAGAYQVRDSALVHQERLRTGAAANFHDPQDVTDVVAGRTHHNIGIGHGNARAFAGLVTGRRVVPADEVDAAAEAAAGDVRAELRQLASDLVDRKLAAAQGRGVQGEPFGLEDAAPGGAVSDAVVPVPEAVEPPTARALTSGLSALPVPELLEAVSRLSPEHRRWLAGQEEFVASVRERSSVAEFAQFGARLLVVVPGESARPVSARWEAYAQVARMLQDPDAVAQLLTSGASVVILPQDVPLGAVSSFAGLHGPDGRGLDDLRGAQSGLVAAVPEENLLGETTPVGPVPHQPEGYSSATHEIAHLIHTTALTDADRHLISRVFQERLAAGPDAPWPDGIRRDLSGADADNYSSTDEFEYFAQLSNAYLGTNHGHDTTTGRPRNNGAPWVRANEPALLPLLERLYGTDPQTPHDSTANPVTATTADNNLYEAFRDFMTGIGEGQESAPALSAQPSPAPLVPADAASGLHAAPPGPAKQVTADVMDAYYRAYAEFFETDSSAAHFDSGYYVFAYGQDVVVPKLATHPSMLNQLRAFHDQLTRVRNEQAAEATPIVHRDGEPMRLYRKMAAAEAAQFLGKAPTAGLNAAMAYNRSDEHRKFFTTSLSHTNVFHNQNAASDEEVVLEFTLPWRGYWDFAARYGTPNQKPGAYKIRDSALLHQEQLRLGDSANFETQEDVDAVLTGHTHHNIGIGHGNARDFGRLLTGIRQVSPQEVVRDAEAAVAAAREARRPAIDALITERVAPLREREAATVHAAPTPAAPTGPASRFTPEVSAAFRRAYVDHFFSPARTASDFASVYYTFVDEQNIVTRELATDSRLLPAMEKFHAELLGVEEDRAAEATPIAHRDGEPMRLYRKMSAAEAAQFLGKAPTAGLNAAMAYNRSDEHRKWFTTSLSHTNVFHNSLSTSEQDVVLEFTLPWRGYWDFATRYGTPNQKPGAYKIRDSALLHQEQLRLGDSANFETQEDVDAVLTGHTHHNIGIGHGNARDFGRLLTGIRQVSPQEVVQDARAMQELLREEGRRAGHAHLQRKLDQAAGVHGEPFGPVPDGFTFAGPASDAAVHPPESVRPEDAETLVADLSALPVSALLEELPSLPVEHRRWLAGQEAFVASVRERSSVAEFAQFGARLLVVVPGESARPVSARWEAYAQVARMLQDPDAVAQLLTSGASVVVLPQDVPLGAVSSFAGLHGPDGRGLDDLRGAQSGLVAAVPEENLLGETTPVGPVPHQPEGYSSATHEIAHLIHTAALTATDRHLISRVFQERLAAGPDAPWPDGIRRDLAGTDADNYSSTDEYEYFAQLSNAYLGTNHGHDTTTGRPRNNGAAWVHANEPDLLPLLERLYGTAPQPPHDSTANPVTATTADNNVYEAFRDFMTGIGESDPVAEPAVAPPGPQPEPHGETGAPADLHAAPAGPARRITADVMEAYFQAYAEFFETDGSAADFDSGYYVFAYDQDLLVDTLATHDSMREQMRPFHDRLVRIREEQAASPTPIDRQAPAPMRLYRKMSAAEAAQFLGARDPRAGFSAAMAYNRSVEYRKFFTTSLSHTSVFSNANAASDDEVVVEFTLPWDGYWNFIGSHGTPNQQTGAYQIRDSALVHQERLRTGPAANFRSERDVADVLAARTHHNVGIGHGNEKEFARLVTGMREVTPQEVEQAARDAADAARQARRARIDAVVAERVAPLRRREAAAVHAAPAGTVAPPPPSGEDTGGPAQASGEGLTLVDALVDAFDAHGGLPADPDGSVPVDDLDGLGVTLTSGRRAQAILLGGSLPVRDLGLTPAQHLRWLLARSAGTDGGHGGDGGEGTGGSGADTADGTWERAVAAAATALGVEIVVVAPDGRPRSFGVGRHGTVRLLFDGVRYSVPKVPS